MFAANCNRRCDARGVKVGRPELDLQVGNPEVIGVEEVGRANSSRIARVRQQADGGVREEHNGSPRDEVGGHARHDIAVVGVHVAIIEVQLARRLQGGVGAERERSR